MQTRIILISIIILTCYISFSQKQANDQQHFIGLNAGQMNGLGASYRYSLKNFTTQVTTVGYIRTVKYRFNIGLSFLHNFHSNEKSDFFIGVSGRWKHYKDERFHYDEDKSNFSLQKIRVNQINTGLNIDYFRRLSEDFRLNLSLGYGVYNLLAGVTELHLFNDFFNNLYSFSIGNKPFTSISGGIGIYYKI